MFASRTSLEMLPSNKRQLCCSRVKKRVTCLTLSSTLNYESGCNWAGENMSVEAIYFPWFQVSFKLHCFAILYVRCMTMYLVYKYLVNRWKQTESFKKSYRSKIEKTAETKKPKTEEKILVWEKSPSEKTERATLTDFWRKIIISKFYFLAFEM